LNNSNLKWLYLFILALLWGSSFILIKRGLNGLTPLQLGSLRNVIAGLFLLFIGFHKIKEVKKKHWPWIILSGFIGSFFPTYLFAYAETEIDSAIAAILNSTVPLIAFILGILFFQTTFNKKQFIGVSIGLVGSAGLILTGANINQDQNYWYAFLPIIASTLYAFNANIIKTHLEKLPALSIATASFIAIIFPAFGVLIYTGFFNQEFLSNEEVQTSILYISVLAILGTAMAKIIFNRLIQLSNAVFSTSVTYLIPVVALGWGILDGEKFEFIQLIAGAVILIGVYLANKKKRKPVS